ncbi:MAG: hypothetical protein QN229_01440 [Desulfurococcaceae archaeon TW002]
MSDAGNAESSYLLRMDLTYLIIFALLFVSFFTLINLMSPVLRFQENSLQKFFTVLNITSFITLIAALILHTVYLSKNTTKILLISCGIFIVSYYSDIAIKAFSRSLTIILYPLLIELRGSSNSAYVIDLPQIIIISLLTYYTYKKYKNRGILKK